MNECSVLGDRSITVGPSRRCSADATVIRVLTTFVGKPPLRGLYFQGELAFLGMTSSPGFRTGA